MMVEQNNPLEKITDYLQKAMFKTVLLRYHTRRTIESIRSDLNRTNFDFQEQQKKAAQFSADFLDYLRQIQPLGLQPVRPTKTQLNVLLELLHSVTEGELYLNKISKGLGSNSIFAITLRTTKSIKPNFRDIPLNELSEQIYEVLAREKDIYYTTMWDAVKEIPVYAYFLGHVGHTFVKYEGANDGGVIDFLFTERKAETTNDLEAQLGLTKPDKVDIYGEGSRIIFTSRFKGLTGEYEHVNQYFYIGNFEAIRCNKEYHVYASNARIHDDISPIVTEASRELAFVRINL